jgi:DNA polymerase
VILLAGQQVPAGLWISTALPDIDFETYSEAGYAWVDPGKWQSISGKGKPSGLSQVGAPVYAEHHSTEILSVAYNLKDGLGPRHWFPGMPAPQDLFDHVTAGGLLEAHNSLFEYLIWFYVATPKLGWPVLPLRSLRCSSSKARAYSYPGGLDRITKIIGGELKDSVLGKKVIRRYCCPRQPTKNDNRRRIAPGDDAGIIELYQYNVQDIVAETNVSTHCPDLSETELENWYIDQEINARGVQIDVSSVKALSAIIDQGKEHYDDRMALITDGAVANTSKVKDLLTWLATRGCYLDNLDETSIFWALDQAYDETVLEALTIRKSTSSAGVKKLQALTKRTSSDGRMRDSFVFYRAITGRFSSEGLQLQNMVASGPSMGLSGCCGYYFPVALHQFCPICQIMDPLTDPVEWDANVMDKTIELLVTCDFERANFYLGAELYGAIAASMRGMVVSAPGHDLMCSDYSAIEAVTLAVLAGEQWRIDVFNTHGKIYEMCAAKITGIPFEEIRDYAMLHGGSNHPARKPFGKVPELASGYQGWIGAWEQFGAGKYMTEEEMKTNILKWREDSPMIVELWGGQYRETEPGSWNFNWELYGLEGTAIKAVLDPGNWYTYRLISYGVHNDVLYCRLPSGRCLSYHQPRLESGEDRRSKQECYRLTHMINNTNPKKGAMGWIRTDTYGGMLTENANQAVARDLQCNGMKNVAQAGYPIVAHVHDEIVAEVPHGQGNIAQFENLMMTLPDWAAGWPIKAAGGWRGHRYRKE